MRVLRHAAAGGLDVYVISCPPVSGHVERMLTVNICVDEIAGLLDCGSRVCLL